MSTDQSILEVFRDEAREHLAGLEKGFLDLETAPSPEARAALVTRLFRHAHSLKGAARAVELDQLQQRGQVLEDTLAEFREQPSAIDRAAIDRGLAQFDALQQSFAEWEQKKSEAEVPAAGRQPDAANDPADPPAQVADQPAAAQRPAEGLAEAPGGAIPPPSRPTAERTAAASVPAREEEKFTVRVASDRLDRMLSLAGELRISQRGAEAEAGHLAGLHEQLATLGGAWDRQSSQENRHALEAAVDYVRRIQTELHQRHVREQLLLGSLELDIRESRLLPLAMLAESLRRGVRDLAQSLGKQIRYEVKVGDVLLDKAVIEALRDPLLHMLRNAAHHGLETPDERLAAGKPEEGVIVLQAVRQGDRVRITLSDDGRGVDFARIRERVSRLGPPDGSQAAQLTEQKLAAYLFRPGFTTAVTSDAISGRGVGLDVVDDAMRRLQGRVELEAGDRTGTTFALTVPVTISTVRILTVSSGGQHYGIPGSMIVRTARARRDQLRELEGSLVLTVDGQPVPWVPLADLVGAAGSVSPAEGGACPYVLVAREGQRVAIAVDDMEDEAEVLLKPLGFPLTGMRGVMGGTIRPDGSVQIVLDIVSSAFRPLCGGARGPVSAAQPAVRILVVDDSPTTRSILRNVFAAAGYAVRTAVDGVDALEQLRSHGVQLVVCDLEMPRLNGFELTRRVKSQFGLPVVLVTGLDKEEDRRQGLEAGADAYVVKSTFHGEGLLEVVRQLVGP